MSFEMTVYCERQVANEVKQSEATSGSNEKTRNMVVGVLRQAQNDNQQRLILRVMKLTAFILLTACLVAGATGNAQRISLNLKTVPLERAFDAIEKQTGYSFVYTDKLLQDAKKVTVEITNGTLEQALALCFKDQPFTYTISDKFIVIKVKSLNENPGDISPDHQITQSPIDITGKVTDADGNPLAGATVKVKGSNKATTTNNDGVFVLKGVDDNAMLEISFVGYQTLAIAVNGKTSIITALKMDVQNLNEVVINKGYYTEKQKYSVGNVGKVTAKDIEKQPVSNPLLALQGRVAGLFITQSTGVPGSGVVVRIQGQNSIVYGNDPLYVIDGVPYTSQLLPNMAGILGGSGGANINGVEPGQGNPLSFLNSSDIESIEILKDADATAIYGSRAANGAILITTKKGSSGDTRVDFSVRQGWGKVNRTMNLLNTKQYLEMRREAKTNDNLPVFASDYDINGTWDTTRYTDWQKELIGGTAKYMNYRTSVSGGSATTKFFVAGVYHKETTVYPGDFNNQKASVNFNVNNVSINQRFRFDISANYLWDNKHLPASDFTSLAMTIAPNAPSLYNPDGSLNWAPDPSTGFGTWVNPYSYLNNNYRTQTNNLLANAVVEYILLKSLHIKTNIGYNVLDADEKNLVASTFNDPAIAPYLGDYLRYAQYGNSRISSWIIEPNASYSWNLGKAKFEALAGYTLQRNNNNAERFFGRGYNSDLVLEDLKAASTLTVQSTLSSVYKYTAVYGRLNLNWLDKYVVNLTTRRDGSSRFGSNNQFHNFASVGAAWIFSNEPFFQDNIHFLSYGKTRASYGTSGNDQIGDYQFLSQYLPSNGLPYQGATGLNVNNISNPYLQWEETKKLQLGLDLGFLKDRVIINTSYFNNRSSNQLLSYSLPIMTGVYSIARNFPATVRNYGWEISLSSTNINSKALQWTTGFNLTLLRNKLVDFPDIASSSYANSLVIGQPVSIRKLYHFLGVDASTGIYQFADGNGGITNRPDTIQSVAQKVVVSTLPEFYGGFQNTVSYKSIQLSFLFQFVKQKGMSYRFGNLSGGNHNINQPQYVLERWNKPGQKTNIQKYNSDYSLIMPSVNAALLSDAAWKDASYIRLKNVSLSWQMPTAWMKKIHFTSSRIFMEGQNLWTITNYKGLDPESLSTTNLPPLRMMVAGIQLTL